MEEYTERYHSTERTFDVFHMLTKNGKAETYQMDDYIS